MTVYSMPHCPQCDLLKAQLKQNGYEFTVLTDEQMLREKGITNVPTVELADGTLLDFRTVLTGLQQGVMYG